MTTFEDGPAKGQCLMLTRAPLYLRVVHVRMNHFDALDQLDDRPRDDENIYAYKLNGKAGSCHINRRGGSGGFFTVANYSLVKNQPTDLVMRDTEDWRRWCHAQQNPAAPVEPKQVQESFRLLD